MTDYLFDNLVWLTVSGWAVMTAMLTHWESKLNQQQVRKMKRENHLQQVKHERETSDLRAKYEAVVLAERFRVEQAAQEAEHCRRAFIGAVQGMNRMGYEVWQEDDGMMVVTHIATEEERARFRVEMH